MFKKSFSGSSGAGRIERWFLVANVALVLILGVVLVFLREPIIGGIKSYRAASLLEEAQVSFDDGLWDQASRRGSVAHNLDPDNLDIQLLVARALLKERMADAIVWWRRAIRHPDVPPEELQVLIRLLLMSRQIDDAMLFLNRLYDLDPDGEETRRLWLMSLDMQRRLNYSYAVIGELAAAHSEDWSIHQRFLSLEQRRSDSDGNNFAASHLLGLIRSGSSLATIGARELLIMPSVDSEVRIEAANFLKEQTQELINVLMAVTVLHEEGEASHDEMLEVASVLLASEEPDKLDKLAQWANWTGEQEWFLAKVDWTQYAASGADADLYLRAMMELGKYRELVQLAEREFDVRSRNAGELLYFRSEALSALGDVSAAENVLDIAVRSVDARFTAGLERYLVRGNRFDQLAALYERLLETSTGRQATILRQKLLATYYQSGDGRKIERLLDGIELSEFVDRPETLPFLSYLKLMFAPSGATSIHSQLEQMLLDYPEVLDYRLLVALSFHRQEMYTVAASMAQGMPEISLNSPRFIRVSSAILGLAPADKMLNPYEWDMLLPQEIRMISQFGSNL